MPPGLLVSRSQWAGRQEQPYSGRCNGPTASILIGSDDETWDVALAVPVEVVDRIVELVADL
jgi:hypothetical protein